MASGKEIPVAVFCMGEGSGGSQPAAAAAEGVTVTVAPSSPLPVPPPEPVPLEPAAVDDVAAREIAPAAAAGGFACEVCGARYPTEKAMFGHLRCHRDRGWRGAFSPPTFTMEEFAEFQEHLIKPEEEQLREIEEEERAAAAAAVAEDGGERVVLDVDLNVEAAPVEEFIVPDLNLPPHDEE